MNKLFKTLSTAGFVLLVSAVGFGSNVIASTPDGETPANEGVCDGLKADGITPSLYGLCVAYCEAQDLDTFDKEPPSTKILDNYNKRKATTDPDMPCIQVPCPCWSDAELGSITADDMAAACPRSPGKVQIIDNAPKTHFAEANTNPNQERCRYTDLNLVPKIIRSFTITPAEAQSCYAAVEAACNTLEL